MSEVIDSTATQVADEAPQQQRAEDQIIKIDGQDHRFGDLPKEVQEMIAVLSRWNMELVDKRLETAKLEHALKSLTGEISKAMKAKDDKSAKPAMEIRGE